MKRNIFIAFFLAVLSSSAAQTNDTVISFGDRLPYLYYWDTNWLDSWYYKFYSLNPNTNGIPYVINYNYVLGTPIFLARTCHTPTPLKIIGIAGFPQIYDQGPNSNGSNLETLDTTLEGRWPEYYRLYVVDGDSIRFAAETRWDTATSNKSLEFYNDFGEAITFPLYEAYFNEPVIVDGLFFVGGTQYNNYWITVPDSANPFTGYVCDVPAHLFTQYLIIIFSKYSPYTNTIDVYPDPDYTLYQWLNISDDRANPDLHDRDTSLHLSGDAPIGYAALHKRNPTFLAIFDTSYVYIPKDSLDDKPCYTPTGFHVDAVDTATVTLAWTHWESTVWQLQIFPADSIPDSTAVESVAVNMIVLSDLDTATTYAARLRTLCAHDSVSEWTDTVQFRLLPVIDTSHHSDPGDDTLAVGSPVDTYTYLFPNPASTNLTVVSSFHLHRIEIFSADGRLLKTVPAQGISTTVDISTLPPATYIVRITTPSGTTTKRMVKQ